MRLYALVFVFSASAWSQSPQSWTVQGTVYDRQSGEPIRKATLVLAASNEGPRDTMREGPDAITDPGGGFVLSGIRAGLYRIRVRHPRYLELDEQTLTLAAGQKVTGLRIGLVPHGVISGRALDEDGDPYVYGMVVAHKLTWYKGRPMYRTVGNSIIDDRGEYRISGLEAGRYILQVLPSMQMQRSSTSSRAVYLPTLYPGVTQWAGARQVALAAGQQLSAMDITLQKGPVFRVAGTVTGKCGCGGKWHMESLAASGRR